jgi:hypothetical protein
MHAIQQIEKRVSRKKCPRLTIRTFVVSIFAHTFLHVLFILKLFSPLFLEKSKNHTSHRTNQGGKSTTLVRRRTSEILKSRLASSWN